MKSLGPIRATGKVVTDNLSVKMMNSEGVVSVKMMKSEGIVRVKMMKSECFVSVSSVWR